MPQRERDHRDRDDDHRRECAAIRDDHVRLRRRPNREIQHAGADHVDRVREQRVSARVKDLRPQQQSDAASDADQHPHRRSDPVVVERVLQKERGTDQNGGNANAIQPMRADRRFDRRVDPRRRLLRWFHARRCLGDDRRRFSLLHAETLLDGAHTLEKSRELLPNVMQIIGIRHSDNLHHSLTARPEELKITARRFFVWRTHENF